jgi:hypothetical protein
LNDGPPDDLAGRRQRQDVALVAEQGDRVAGRLHGCLPSGGDRRIGGPGVDAVGVGVLDARLIEQSEVELQRQDPPHRLVYPGMGDRASCDVLHDRCLPLVGTEDLHAHVDAGVDGLRDGTGQIVNLTPTRGKAAYNLMRGNAKVGHAVDAQGLGDRAFEISGPNAASIYFDKGDALVLVRVEIRSATSPPMGQARVLAKSAAGRI